MTFKTTSYFAIFTSVLWTELEKEVQVLEGINICVKLETKYKPNQCPWDTWKPTIKAYSSLQCISYSQGNDPFVYRQKSLAFGDVKEYARKNTVWLQDSQRTSRLQLHFITVPIVWRMWNFCCCEFLVSYRGPRKHILPSVVPNPSPSLPQNTTMTHLCTYKRAIPNI